jgi:hypothetical protein
MTIRTPDGPVFGGSLYLCEWTVFEEVGSKQLFRLQQSNCISTGSKKNLLEICIGAPQIDFTQFPVKGRQRQSWQKNVVSTYVQWSLKTGLVDHLKTRRIYPVFQWSSIRMPVSSLDRPERNGAVLHPNINWQLFFPSQSRNIPNNFKAIKISRIWITDI